MRFNKLLQAALLSLTIVQSAALSIGAGQRLMVKPYKRQAFIPYSCAASAFSSTLATSIHFGSRFQASGSMFYRKLKPWGTIASRSTLTGHSWKAKKATSRLIYVNGYQFGKYVHNIGPQDIFPVPEGIWNYRGENHVAVSLWVLEKGGAKVESLRLLAGPAVQSGYGTAVPAPQTGWVRREGAYRGVGDWFGLGDPGTTTDALV